MKKIPSSAWLFLPLTAISLVAISLGFLPARNPAIPQCCRVPTKITYVVQKDDKVDKGGKTYSTGRKTDLKKLALLRAASLSKYGAMLKALPKVTAASWDCRTLGLVGPIQNQGNCGSCWDFSGTDICTSAFYKAGQLKNDGTPNSYLCQQYILDCCPSGGCNGDDNITVTAWCKSTGMPTQADYGPYQAREGSCKLKPGTKMYVAQDWGFCTTTDKYGVATVQDIKNAMVAFGPIGAAIAADDAFVNVQVGQVFHGNSNQINHDIVLVGWDDSKEAWLLRNSWGVSWCDKGYCWIAYGANMVGTEAVWVSALPAPPSPPQPPTPPSPPSPPLPGNPITITLTSEQVQQVITGSGSLTITGDTTLRQIAEQLKLNQAKEKQP